MTAPLGIPGPGVPGLDALPPLDPGGAADAAGPSIDQKLDEMIAMQQAILAILEGGGAAPPPGIGAPPGAGPIGGVPF